MKFSKYPFMAGVNCLKAIYLHMNNPELKSPLTEQNELTFNKAKVVGIDGRNIFEGGLDISQGGTVYGKALIEATKQAFDSKRQVFYEAAFESDDGLFNCVCDIFIRSEKVYTVMEIKSSTKMKVPEHIFDIGIQYRVLRNHPEFKKFRFYIAHLNSDYIKDGPIDFDKLFTIEDVTRRAADVQTLIDKYLHEFKTVLKKKSPPAIAIGKHCTKSYECAFYKHCWQDTPANSVYNVGISGKLIEKLAKLGITNVEDIPRDTNLSEKQWIEIDSQIVRKPSINHAKIKEFLRTCDPEKELLFMDFESMMPAIPLFDGTKCYQQLCFQYSIIYRKHTIAPMERREFLAEPGGDPRRQFIQNLLRDTQGTGKIVVYNKTFEETRLKELAVLFPEYEKQIINRISRIIDLMEPFAKRHYYHPSFQKRYSIKVVLPVLCPEMESAYKHLPINNGSVAMNKYELMDSMSPRERMETKIALKEYCYTDVLAMVKILEKLNQITNI